VNSPSLSQYQRDLGTANSLQQEQPLTGERHQHGFQHGNQQEPVPARLRHSKLAAVGAGINGAATSAWHLT
jgi:hypothetical protein